MTGIAACVTRVVVQPRLGVQLDGFGFGGWTFRESYREEDDTSIT